ncbi:ABC transporter substrate-binding protein [Rhizobium fabae]|uniref:Sorbitol/mannitol transport system substrate-binding protein n=1 Tax=Rhizobium fabae TaxID=573179 RepID=A0A7W6FL33_9HYPH|nr:sugar ABC transporter substrate-binding protein [Rhizobium fabae]MBB3917752.1 sorbitol/mannitol transport system substrate-binding protein [Rhizobium fabae]
MQKLLKVGLLSTFLAGMAFANSAMAESLTIATVNNGDMVVMQKLSSQFTAETGIDLSWVVLEENVLNQRVTTDVATGSGQFDVVTIGAYTTPIWGKLGWLAELNDLGPDYDTDDVLPTVKTALSVDGKMYASPFYAESSFTFYRKDLFEKAGLTMPEQPTYAQIAEFAAKVDDKANGVYGICLRGKARVGENVSYLGAVINTFGGRWFDESWKPELNSEPWKKAVGFYVDLLQKYGPPGASSNGFNENLALFSTGHCAMWIDATVAAGMLFDPKKSSVSKEVGYVQSPLQDHVEGARSFWSWGLGIPASSKKVELAKKFIIWATSKDYIKRVAVSEGWVAIPPGTRFSTYKLPEYLAAAPFAEPTLKAILSVDTTKPNYRTVPYIGAHYVVIPEFQAIGSTLGQMIAGALTGGSTVDEALDQAQSSTERMMQQAGYYNN